jgi:hypothetical protein
MVLLLPNVLWHQGLRKYAQSYRQKRYSNAKLLCEEGNVIFLVGLKNSNQLRRKSSLII